MRLVSRNHFIKIGGLSVAALALPSISFFDETKKDFLKIGLCGDSKKSALAKKAGCSYIEEAVAKILMPDKTDAEFRQQLEDLSHQPLQTECFNIFLPRELKAVGDHTKHEEIVKYASVAFERAEKVGAGIILFGIGGSRSIPDGFDRAKAKEQFIQLCKLLAPLAAAHKITLAVEQLNKEECNFINTMRESAEMVAGVNHTN